MGAISPHALSNITSPVMATMAGKLFLRISLLSLRNNCEVVNKKFIPDFKKALFDPAPFEEKALALFRFQASANQIYRKYLEFLHCNPAKISSIAQIPFLPIEFFKYHPVVSITGPPAVLFESSSTTGQIRSQYYVYDTGFYKKVAQHIFEQFYGALSGFYVLALRPSYVERSGSSLVYMTKHFIGESGSPDSGFSSIIRSNWLIKLKYYPGKTKKYCSLVSLLPCWT